MLSKFKYDKYCLLLKTIEVFLRAENYLTENGKGSIQVGLADGSSCWGCGLPPIWSQIKHISVPTLFVCFSPLHPCSVSTTAGGVSGVVELTGFQLPGDQGTLYKVLTRGVEVIAWFPYFGD
jgi:hypothetical protein